MFYKTVDPNSPELVASVIDGYYYPCPDLDSLDKHLTMLLTEFLGTKSNCTQVRKDLARQDLDRLLDRRCYLEMVDAPATHQ